MAIINSEKCIGCRECQKYCTVEAILFSTEEKKCYIDQSRCTECYVCLRRKICFKAAIEPTELHDFYKQFQHLISDPVESKALTGVTGRGTGEVKNNDVTGRVKKGEVGICIDIGRPGFGVYLKDAEKVAMACVRAGVKLAPKEANSFGILIEDYSTGKLKEECPNYHLLSMIIEGYCKEEDLKKVLIELKKVEKEIDTVFSLGILVRTDEKGKTKALDCLEELGIEQPYRGKVNVGLGKPLSLA